MMPVATILKMPYIVRTALLTALVAVVVVGFLAVRVVVNHQGLDQIESSESLLAPSESQSLEERYGVEVQKILSEYVEQAQDQSPNLGALTTEAQNRLLALKVPASQRDAHLALVLDFDAVKMAISENSSTSINMALTAITAQLKAKE